MIRLPNVSLLILNPAHGSELSASIIRFLQKHIEFGEVVHMTDRRPKTFLDARHVEIPRMKWKEAQRWQALEIGRHFNKPFMLHIETDGFPFNFHLWDQAFLDWDYVGAPWPKGVLACPEQNEVGNGGCSIQSRKFRDVLWNNRHLYRDGLPSDVFFAMPEMMEKHREAGVRFAPKEVAIRFSFENPMPEFQGWHYSKSFAFHGKIGECATMIGEAVRKGCPKERQEENPDMGGFFTDQRFSMPKETLPYLYIHPHDGIGDHLICNALYRKLATLHNTIGLFVRPNLVESIKFMLRDVHNIEIIPKHDCWNTPPERPLLGLGLNEAGQVRWGYVQGYYKSTWDHTFYHQCGFDPSLKWDGFRMERDRNREMEFARKINPSNEPFILYMSRGSDNIERIRPSDLPNEYRRFEVKPLSDNFFDWLGMLEQAEEIHSIDSSLKWLVEFFPTKARLYYHTLWKRRGNHLHVSKRDWIIT